MIWSEIQSKSQREFELAQDMLEPQLIVRAAPGEPADAEGFTLYRQTNLELAKRRAAFSKAWRVGFGGLLVLLLTKSLEAMRGIAARVTFFPPRPAALVSGRYLASITLTPRLLAQRPLALRG